MTINDRTVVIAVDDSPQSQHAFTYAVENILRDTDKLRIIHVQPFHEIIDVVAYEEMEDSPIYSAGQVTKESYAIAQKYAGLCETHGIREYKEDVILEDGSASTAICKYLEGIPQESSDNVLLVLGSRELGFFKKAFLGSVSDRVVDHAHCPVVVVKMPYKGERSSME